MTKIFTRDAVTEALNSVVAEKGEDYVYPLAGSTCFYADPDSSVAAPSCIVGHVVAALSLELFQEVASFEGGEGTFSASDIPEEFSVQVEGEKDDDAETRLVFQALECAQAIQDYGWPWSVAVKGYNLVLEGWNAWDARVHLGASRPKSEVKP